MTIFWEIIGYIGTAFVLISMMMSSVTQLRIFNLSGSIFSLVYGLATGAMPVFILNLCLAVINAVKLYRLRKAKKEEMK